MLTEAENAENRRLAFERAFGHGAVCFAVQIPILVLYAFSEQGYVVEILYCPLFSVLGSDLSFARAFLLPIMAYLYSLVIAVALFFWRRCRDGEWRRPDPFRIKRTSLTLATAFVLGSLSVAGGLEYRVRVAHAGDIKCTVQGYETTVYAEWGEHRIWENRFDGVKVKLESADGIETAWLVRPWENGRPVRGYPRVGAVFYVKSLLPTEFSPRYDGTKYYWYRDVEIVE